MGFTFSREFLALLDCAKEATAKQREAKQLLESARDDEARRFEEKRRAEEIATGNIRRFVESEGWTPDRMFGTVGRPVEPVSPNAIIVKRVVNGQEVREVK